MRWLAPVLVAAALCGVAPARAQVDPPGRVGRVAQVAGDVRTVDADGAWVALPRNQPLATGDRVITDKAGQATLEIGSSTLRVGPYSDVSVAQLDDQKIRVHFDHGQLAVRVRSADILGELSIETDEGVWVPHHPGLFRFDRIPGQVLAAQAWSGDMLLEAPDSSLPVAADQRAEVWREQAVTHYRMVPVPVDAFSDWVLVEDRLDDRYAAANAAAAASAALPAEMTGASELARYGQWSDSSDDGPLWTPDDVPTGWAPYQDGAWTWIAPWGWTWVDDDAWGFAPFHYGRWVHRRGRWGWAPGRWSGRPTYAPALVGWLGGPGTTAGGGPGVGWVPLAPGEPFRPGYPASPGYLDAVNGGGPRRGVQPVKGRPTATRGAPGVYANRDVPGAVAVVPANALRPGVPVSAMARGDRLRPAKMDASAARAVALPPPAPPAGRTAAGVPAIAAMPPAALQRRPEIAAPMPIATPRARPAAPVAPIVPIPRAVPAIAPPIAPRPVPEPRAAEPPDDRR